MNKAYGLILMVFLVLVGSVSAVAVRIAVRGGIYGPDGEPIQGADIHIECDGAEKDTVSKTDGGYLVYFTSPPTNCTSGDTATVTATKDGASGTNNGIVGYNPPHPIDVALVNVTIPEFGTITAGLALVGSSLGYVFMRRKMDSKRNRK